MDLVSRQPDLYRRLVRDQGPDRGRYVDRLKHPDRALELLNTYEQGFTDGAEVTNTTGFLFMYDRSAYDGADPYG